MHNPIKKKLISLSLILLILLSLSSCKEKIEPEVNKTTTENTNATNSEVEESKSLESQTISDLNLNSDSSNQVKDNYSTIIIQKSPVSEEIKTKFKEGLIELYDNKPGFEANNLDIGQYSLTYDSTKFQELELATIPLSGFNPLKSDSEIKDFEWKAANTVSDEIIKLFTESGLGKFKMISMESLSQPENQLNVLIMNEEPKPIIDFYVGKAALVFNDLPLLTLNNYQNEYSITSFIYAQDGPLQIYLENFYQLKEIKSDESKIIEESTARLEAYKWAQTFEQEFNPEVSFDSVDLMYVPAKYITNEVDTSNQLECVPAYVYVYKYKGGNNPRNDDPESYKYRAYFIDARTGQYFLPPVDPSIPNEA